MRLDDDAPLVRVILFSAKAFLALCTLGVYPLVFPMIPRLMNRMAHEDSVRREMYRDQVRREARRRAGR